LVLFGVAKKTLAIASFFWRCRPRCGGTSPKTKCQNIAAAAALTHFIDLQRRGQHSDGLPLDRRDGHLCRRLLHAGDELAHGRPDIVPARPHAAARVERLCCCLGCFFGVCVLCVLRVVCVCVCGVLRVACACCVVSLCHTHGTATTRFPHLIAIYTLLNPELKASKASRMAARDRAICPRHCAAQCAGVSGIKLAFYEINKLFMCL
jgi:hypothetical protein